MFDPFDYEHIVFDWNGTVIDDVNLAFNSLNAVRGSMNMPSVTLEEYRQHFRFPIKAFYSDLGFDFSLRSFPNVVQEYLSLFDSRVADCSLCPGAHDLILALHDRGKQVSVLSASHQDILQKTAKRHQIETFIHNLFGLDDSSAHGKLSRARDLDCRLTRQDFASVLMVGDTDHDYEVAKDRGWDFLAVATGHQSYRRLAALDVPVVETLEKIKPQSLQ